MKRARAATPAVLAVSLFGMSCASAPPAAPPAENRMRAILESSPNLAPILGEAGRYRLQAVLGTVEPGPDGRPRLIQEGFRADAEYFYPASTVKLLVAAVALERLAELRAETGLALDADTPLAFHPRFPGDELADRDPSNIDGGAITVRHEIRKLFLVSDNPAFNRLYEIVGQDRLARSLTRAGLPHARLIHRLARPMSAEDNRRMPRVDFLNADGSVLYTLPERESQPLPEAPPVPGSRVGEAWLTNDDPQQRVEGPMDFTPKNRVSLLDLQRAMCMIVAPEVDCGGPGFELSAEDRALLLDPLHGLAGDSRNPVYDRAEHPDDEVRPFRPGLLRVVPADRLEVYDKVGWSYGFSLDTAWIVDRGTGRSFFLAATLYTNADGVINDDQYEYKTVAWPFLADLAEATARYLWR